MKKLMVGSSLLVALGIFMGVLLVSNFSTESIGDIFASEKKFGAENPPVVQSEAMKTLNNAFTNVSEAVLPSVVSIEVTASRSDKVDPQMEELYKFFRPKRDGEENEDLEDETLIQFGMEDVELRIKNIIAKINDNSIKGFAKVTGEMLHQLQEGFPKLTEKEILNINSNNVEIILNRVKNNLSEADRKNILRLLDTQELLQKKELAYFLTKLEDIYVQQRELDSSIKDFEKVCNQYLVGKEFYFDESSVTLYIYNYNTKEKVELNQLSSGEKQIVSLFSKLYLEELDNQLIFFDEPELSLSIKWQKQLLPHVLASGKCNFLLAVTHSPFIFNNELEEFAIGMNTFID